MFVFDVRSSVLKIEFGGALCWPHFNNWNSCCIWHLISSFDPKDFVPKLHGQLSASSSVVHEIAKHTNVISRMGVFEEETCLEQINVFFDHL